MEIKISKSVTHHLRKVKEILINNDFVVFNYLKSTLLKHKQFFSDRGTTFFNNFILKNSYLSRLYVASLKFIN